MNPFSACFVFCNIKHLFVLNRVEESPENGYLVDGDYIMLDDEDDDGVDEESFAEVLESDFSYLKRNANLETLLNAVAVLSPLVSIYFVSFCFFEPFLRKRSKF